MSNSKLLKLSADINAGALHALASPWGLSANIFKGNYLLGLIYGEEGLNFELIQWDVDSLEKDLQFKELSQSDHVDWITKWLQREVKFKEGVEPKASAWSERSHQVQQERDYIKGLSEDLERAKEAFNVLDQCFKKEIRLRIAYSRKAGFEYDPMFSRSFEWIENQLQIVESWLMRASKCMTHGNFPTNRSLCIVEIWEALKPHEVSMRAAARIMSEAFECVGLETDDGGKRKESIYQAIREHQVRSR